MSTLLRAAAGAAMGVLAASGTPIVWMLFLAALQGVEGWFVLMGVVSVVPVIVALAGPGAVVFGALHAVCMKRVARQCRTVREIRIVGVVAGVALGVATLLLTVGLYQLFARFTTRFTNVPNVLLGWLVAALAGGAGLGWGGTFGLEPGRAACERGLR